MEEGTSIWMRGNLTKDPLIHHYDDTSVAYLSIATDLPDGSHDIWQVRARGIPAAYIKAHQARKGDYIVVHGNLTQRKDRNQWEVRASLICMDTSLTWKPNK